MTLTKKYRGVYAKTRHCVMYITVRHHILTVSCTAHKSWGEEITRLPVAQVLAIFKAHAASERKKHEGQDQSSR